MRVPDHIVVFVLLAAAVLIAALTGLAAAVK